MRVKYVFVPPRWLDGVTATIYVGAGGAARIAVDDSLVNDHDREVLCAAGAALCATVWNVPTVRLLRTHPPLPTNLLTTLPDGGMGMLVPLEIREDLAQRLGALWTGLLCCHSSPPRLEFQLTI